MTNVEHYCLDCTFRPWLDATGNLVATLVIKRAGGRKIVTDRIRPDVFGRFRSHMKLRGGDSARITIDDAWGDTTATPKKLARRS